MTNKKKKKQLSKSFYKKIILLLSFALVIFGIYNVYQISAFSSYFDEQIEAVHELSRPAQIQVYTITKADCTDCLDVSTFVEPIKKAGYNITRSSDIEFGSAQSKELIEKYSIEKIPTVIIVGEINKTKIRNVEERKDALIYTDLAPPYVDAKSGIIVGLVKAITIADLGCDVCFKMDGILEQIKSAGVKISDEQTIDKDSEQGKQLISKYKIDKVPTLILSSGLKAYGSEIVDLFSRIGYAATDGSYVTSLKAPPYVNLTTGKVAGLVSFISIEDESCKECYHAMELHKRILAGAGMVPQSEKSVDASSQEGKALIQKYNITKVPTILLRGDVGAYGALAAAWLKVGTVEDDGTYVFREMEAIRQTYWDLENNKIVKQET